MKDNSNVRPVSEAQLHRIYDAKSHEKMQMEVRRAFLETDRLDAEGGILDQARAEGFMAGLFFGTSVAFEMGMMSPLFRVGDIETLYPETDEKSETLDERLDAVAEELTEELESLEDESVEETMFDIVD